MNFSKSQLIIIGAVLIVILFFALVFLGLIPGLRPDLASPTKLTVWGVHDSADDFSASLASFNAAYPNIEVSYVSKSPDTYETDLINALALGSAPDVVMVQNSWLPKHANKLSPAPVDIVSLQDVRNLFPGVVESDFTDASGKIYALPLYIDTLALFYNNELFAGANIDFPPTTWDEFLADVNRLKEVDRSGKIILPAAAIGGSLESINRAADLVYLLLLQSGAKMVSDDFRRAVFSEYVKDGLRPGQSALEFYLGFANPNSDHYTWNDTLHYSIDSFSQGDTAMIFNYAHQMDIIQSKNPFLKFSTAPVPQLVGSSVPVNFANYWGLAVLNQSLHREAAWTLVSFLTMNETASASYLSATHRPPALRSLLSSCRQDLELAAFCNQTLTARSWPQPDPDKVSVVFSNAIKDVLSGKLSIPAALKQAQDNTTLLIQQLAPANQ